MPPTVCWALPSNSAESPDLVFRCGPWQFPVKMCVPTTILPDGDQLNILNEGAGSLSPRITYFRARPLSKTRRSHLRIAVRTASMIGLDR